MANMLTALLACLLSGVAYGQAAELHVYGKYFWGNLDYTHNSLALHRSLVTDSKSPLIVQFPGSGWADYYPKWAGITPAIQQYKERGFSFAVATYRTLKHDYFYCQTPSCRINGIKAEEFVHISPDGKVSLDTGGGLMRDYQVSGSYLEQVTKCVFDATQALEYIIAHAEVFLIDLNRILFFASSAGSVEANYLTFVYHKWNSQRYNPIGLVLTEPQFTLPIKIPNALFWDDFAAHMTPGAMLSDVIYFWECNGFFMCPVSYKGCNSTLGASIRQRVCMSEQSFNSVTIAQMHQLSQWVPTNEEYRVGLQEIWLASKYMLNHHPPNLHIFTSNAFVPESWEHHAMFVQMYGEYADRAGIDYTMYLRPYKRMLPNFPAKFPRAAQTATVQSLNYMSSVPWRTLPEVQQLEQAGLGKDKWWAGHHVLFACLVASMPCSPGASTPTSKYAVQQQVAGVPNALLMIALLVSAAIMVNVFRAVRHKPRQSKPLQAEDLSESEKPFVE